MIFMRCIPASMTACSFANIDRNSLPKQSSSTPHIAPAAKAYVRLAM